MSSVQSRTTRLGGWAVAAVILLTTMLLPRDAAAVPQARILRIDPRASMVDGAPILTTVVELVQHKGLASVTGQCGADWSCVANGLVKRRALYTPISLPEEVTYLMVKVEGRDLPVGVQSAERWGDARKAKTDGVGTAWLLLLDTAMSRSQLEQGKDLAKAFVNNMGPEDVVEVALFNATGIWNQPKWTEKKTAAVAEIDGAKSHSRAGHRARSLFTIIKQGAVDGFNELGNVGVAETPMHQAMIVMSTGWAGTDTSSAPPMAGQLSGYLTKGRLDETNEMSPKMPIPVISVWFPMRQTEEFYDNSRQFMEFLANPDIGGGFYIEPGGVGLRIVKAVQERFDQMWLLKFRVPCVAPTVAQTFSLGFKRTSQPIKGDTFANVPVGIDPSTWPLDIDEERTMKEAKKNKLYPGGTVKIYGSFCWGNEAKRVELYMIPKKQQAPESLKGHSIEEAKEARKQLIQSNMRGKCTDASEDHVECDLPDSEKFLSGKGDKMTARLVLVDTQTYRTSAFTSEKILKLPAKETPLNLWLIGGGTFAGVVVLLLLINLLRGGGGGRSRGRRGGGAAPPPPVVAGGHHPPGPAPPPGHGGYQQ